MLTIQYAKDPVYGSTDGQHIYLTVKFYEFSEELPFGATPYDPEPYGVELYNNAIAGLYGPIAPYVPPPPPIPPTDQPTTSGTQTL
jgi:hypothetical protein